MAICAGQGFAEAAGEYLAHRLLRDNDETKGPPEEEKVAVDKRSRETPTRHGKRVPRATLDNSDAQRGAS